MATNLKDAVELLRSGQWLANLKVITADVNKNKGGRLIEYGRCRIARKQTMEASGAATIGKTDTGKNPRHNYHFTLNLELENKEIRKIHPVLIFEINKQKVL